MFNAGVATSVSTLRSNVSVATAINESGEIVGYNFFPFPSGAEAWGINNSGAVAAK